MARSRPPLKAEHSPTYQWHAHAPEEVLTVLNTTAAGLSLPEVEKRYTQHGRNVFTEIPEPALWERTLGQLKSPMVLVLLIAALITVGLQEYIDAVVICFALFIAVLVGVIQEGRASRAFRTLAESQEHIAVVWRNGNKQQIDASDLVPGDVIELQAGMQVPADARLTIAKKLSVNEAPLTGEWLAVDKQVPAVPVGTPLPEQATMVWMGTYIAEGYGVAVIVATGDNTVVGALAQDVQDVEEVETPLQLEMKRVSQVILYIIGAIISVIFIVGIVQGQSLEDMLLMSIAVAVASIPEGLPAAVTIILAVGMESLLKRGGLVRNLLAAETLGSTTYVLTDKTGTLTEATMAVTDFIHIEAEHDAHDTKRDDDWAKDPVAYSMLEVGLCAADSFVDQGSEEEMYRGDPVEVAILEAALEADIAETGESLRGRRVDYLSFTSENRFAAGLTPDLDTNEWKLCVNGAPEVLLDVATEIMTPRGVRAITEEDKAALLAAIASHTTAGERLVATGYKVVSFSDIPDETDGLIDGLIFAGIFVFHDPVRDGVAEAIAGVKDAGAQVFLITGDNRETALSVAEQVGITDGSSLALTGAELEKMSDDELLVALESVPVYARVLPKQKLRIATLLQQRGEVVAMTGDGINDAPALQRANIGVAVGSGTEVAKEAADLVLVNDTFATIHAAIEEGRRIIANLRKIIGYLLSTALSEVTLISAALLVGAPVPILPAQILWSNIIEEGLMSVAFAFEPGEKDAMKRKPQDIHEEGILSREMIYFMGFVALILSSLSLVLYFYFLSIDTPLTELRSIMFIAISMDSLFIAFAFRSLGVPVWRIPLKTNLFFLASFGVSLLLLMLVLSVPFFQLLLSYTPLPWPILAVIVGFSVLSLITVELAKVVFFRHR